MLCGDFNARTGSIPDSLASEFGPIATHYSNDKHVNSNGKDLLNLCKTTNMLIMNGPIEPTANTGYFTCYTPNGQSVVDYIICKCSVMPLFQSMQLIDLLPELDHRPISFDLNCTNRQATNSTSTTDKFACYKWNTEHRHQYQANLKSPKCRHPLWYRANH